MDLLNHLADLGIVRVGEWGRDSNSKIEATLTEHGTAAPVLYAFVSEQGALYIGKTTGTLQKRLNQYRNAHQTQPTNFRLHGLIALSLQLGQRIDIYALVAWEPALHKGVPVNVPAGLEDRLIAQFNPPWNQGRTGG